MKTKHLTGSGLLLVWAIVALSTPLMAQRTFDYPAPTYPNLRDVDGPEDLLEIARTIVNRPSREGTGFAVGWGASNLAREFCWPRTVPLIVTLWQPWRWRSEKPGGK